MWNLMAVADLALKDLEQVQARWVEQNTPEARAERRDASPSAPWEYLWKADE